MKGVIHKSVQFSVYCSLCCNLDDFAEYDNQKMAESFYRSEGWRKTKIGWICPNCATPNKTLAPADAGEETR